MLKDDKKHRPELSRRWEYVTSGIVGLGSAASAAVVTLFKEFWDDIKNTAVIRNVTDETAHRLEHETRDLIRSMGDPAGHLSEVEEAIAKRAMRNGPVTKLVEKIKAEQAEKLNLQMEKMGYASLGALRKYSIGIFDRLGAVSWGSCASIAINSVITAGVSAAAVQMFFNSNVVRQNLNDVKNDIDAINKRLDEPKQMQR